MTLSSSASPQADSAVNPAPRHVGIIMDGNGRWAQQRGATRIFGHQAGVRRVSDIVKAASQLDIKFLTLYSFSTENWQRPHQEVQELFKLIVSFIDQFQDEFLEKNIRFTTIGDLTKLPSLVQKKLKVLIKKSQTHDQMTVCVALNYGGRTDIIRAASLWAKKISQDSSESENLTEEKFAKLLCTSQMPDPELIIRTGGEQRISNFLIWQIAYSELYFTDTLWPDFDDSHFQKAIADYCRRDRRFGALYQSPDGKERQERSKPVNQM